MALTLALASGATAVSLAFARPPLERWLGSGPPDRPRRRPRPLPPAPPPVAPPAPRAFAGATFERWLRRRRRHELAWSIALALFACGALSPWAGAAIGWDGVTLRLLS